MDETELTNQPIYNKELVSKKIVIAFSELSRNLNEQFISHAFKCYVGRCCKEGYISRKNIKVIKYSAPIASGANVIFEVLFEFEIYNPFEGQELYAKVINITKIGIKGVIDIDERKNPVTIFASRLHNAHVIMKDETVNETGDFDLERTMVYGEGDIFKIKVIGHRFEVNDTSVYILGEIIS